MALKDSCSSVHDEVNPASLNLGEGNAELPVIEAQQLQSLLYPSRAATPNDPTVNFHMVTVKPNGERRFCRKCNLEKPDRSHHCSVCGECILKMDHHCPWVNNCVGFYNQKFFLLFVAYTAILCIFVASSLVPGLVGLFRGDTLFTVDTVQLALLGFISGLFGIMLVFFTGFHIYLLLNNRTTIENLERTVYKVGRRDCPTSIKYLNVFNIGT
ncbi:Palmitoyltransferase zdhhc2 [Massospora cicadina]|nr:Palmitoyltransferase zdhhc2 [Massospora cicadina]